MAAKAALTGMVSNQAIIKFFVTPQRTADNRLTAPTPIMAPVMVWVVLTGILSISVRNKVKAPAVSAATPSRGVTLVIREPIVLTIFQPPDIVPNEMTVKQENATQSGKSFILVIPMSIPRV